jgi:hypothetical protein
VPCLWSSYYLASVILARHMSKKSRGLFSKSYA